MKFTRSSIAKWLVFAAVTFTALRVLGAVTGTDISSLSLLPVHTFLMAAALSILFFPLSALRWHAILAGVGIRAPYRRILRIVLAAGPLALLPGRLGDFGRVAGLPPGTPTHIALGSVLVEKDIDVCILLVFSATGLFMLAKPGPGLLCAGIACLLIALTLTGSAMLVKLMPGRYRAYAQDVSDAIRLLRNSPTALLTAFTASGLNWFLSFTQTALVLEAFTGRWMLTSVVAYLPLAIFVGLIPVTLAGVGSRDAAFTALMAGLAPASAVVATAAWYSVLSYGFAFVVGLPFIGALWDRLPESQQLTEKQ